METTIAPRRRSRPAHWPPSGRIAVSASGFNKLLTFASFSASLAGRGLPYPELWAVGAVGIELAAGLALVIGVLPRWSALALIAFTVMATWLAHRYWTLPGPARRQQETQFYKNVAIIGGLLFYFVSGPGRWSWKGGRSLRRERLAD
jgi:putative oxidoreductase